jgi:hypothetical protein
MGSTRGPVGPLGSVARRGGVHVRVSQALTSCSGFGDFDSIGDGVLLAPRGWRDFASPMLAEAKFRWRGGR